MFTIDHSGNNSDHSDNQSDLSDTDDFDFRPDSAMERYRSQQTQNLHSHQRPSVMMTTTTTMTGPANFGHGEESFDARFSPEGEGAVHVAPLSPRMSLHKLREYERSLDEDRHLLKEYERLRELSRHQEQHQQHHHQQQRDPEHPSREPPGRLKELRVPSSPGPRPPHPWRTMSPLTTPFPMGMPDPPLSPGRESPHKDRPRKVR